MIWQPAAREPAALAVLVEAAVRAHVFPGEPGAMRLAPVPGDRWREAVLPDGRVVRVDFKTSPATQRRHGQRACAGLRVDGALAIGRTGYRVEADLLVDLATRAVLSCDSRIEASGL